VALGSLKDLSDSLCSYWPHLEASTTQKAWQGADSPCTGDQRSQAGLPPAEVWGKCELPAAQKAQPGLEVQTGVSVQSECAVLNTHVCEA
jgi:hypothetical protein